MKVYMAPMEGLTDYMFRNAYDKFFGHNKIDKYFMPFISPNKSEKFLAKEMRDISRDNNHINSIPQVMTNNSSDFIWTAHMLYDEFGYDEINLNAGCPSGTVVSKNKGAGMLICLDSLERILYEILSDRYICDNHIKVSVKHVLVSKHLIHGMIYLIFIISSSLRSLSYTHEYELTITEVI